MPKADARTVAKLLREYAQRTALRGGNPYRAKAYSRAADSLTALAEPLDKVIVEGRLRRRRLPPWVRVGARPGARGGKVRIR